VRPRLITCDDSFQKVMSLCGNCRLNALDILRDCCCCRPAGAHCYGPYNHPHTRHACP
ncbi:hypothetical protein L9F63_005451, partial [Diploptera punctata]